MKWLHDVEASNRIEADYAVAELVDHTQVGALSVVAAGGRPDGCFISRRAGGRRTTQVEGAHRS